MLPCSSPTWRSARSSPRRRMRALIYVGPDCGAPPVGEAPSPALRKALGDGASRERRRQELTRSRCANRAYSHRGLLLRPVAFPYGSHTQTEDRDTDADAGTGTDAETDTDAHTASRVEETQRRRSFLIAFNMKRLSSASKILHSDFGSSCFAMLTLSGTSRRNARKIHCASLPSWST